LFFDGWGATAYAQIIAHPQGRLVQTSDLQQLVYLGTAQGSIMVTEDTGFRSMADSILSRRYQLMRVVSLADVLT
jgi:hypothetical protein